MGCLQNHKCTRVSRRVSTLLSSRTQAHTQNWGIGAKHVNKHDFFLISFESNKPFMHVFPHVTDGSLSCPSGLQHHKIVDFIGKNWRKTDRTSLEFPHIICMSSYYDQYFICLPSQDAGLT